MIDARSRALLLLALLLPPLIPAEAPSSADAPPADPTDATDAADAAALGGAILYETDFAARGATLASLGWTTITTVGGRPPYRIEEGRATLAEPGTGGYPQRLDTRLVSPPYDLRWLLGAPLPAPPLDARPLPELLAAGADATAEARANASAQREDAALSWDPQQPLQARVRAAASFPETDQLWPPAPNLTHERIELGDEAPLPDLGSVDLPSLDLLVGIPEGIAAPSLTIRHAWALGAGDRVSLEARALDANATWSVWRPLAARPFTNHSGDSGATTVTVADLSPYLGSIVQVAFRARADAPLPPDSFGHAIERVEIRGTLGAPDVAIEGFGAWRVDGALPLRAPLTPTVQVRNWGASPALAVPVRVRLSTDGQDLPVASQTFILDLAAGERRDVRLPTLSLAAPTNLTLSAQVVRNVTRTHAMDVRPSNDRATLHIRADERRDVALSLVAEPADAVSALGAAKRFRAMLEPLGNAPFLGDVALWAARDGGAPKEVARIAVSLSARTIVPTPALPEVEPNVVELVWVPDARGSYVVEARASGQRSNGVTTHVDLAPPPLLHERFAPPVDATRPYAAEDADALPGWTFESWSVGPAGVEPDAPAAPSGRTLLAASLSDDLGVAEARHAAAAGATADDVAAFTISLPATPASSNDANATTNTSQDISFARVVVVGEELGCPCDDPSARVPALSSLLDAALHVDELSVEKNTTRIALGQGEAGWLYLVWNATLDSGTMADVGPLRVTRGDGDEGVLLPPTAVRGMQDGACCAVGPYGIAQILALLAADAPVETALAPVPATRIFDEHEVTRDLGDLLAATSPLPARNVTLAFEHRAHLVWSSANATGTRGIVALEDARALPGSAPLRRIVLENSSSGWETVRIPLTPVERALPLRLRLTLQSVDRDPAPLAPCDLLAPACAQDPVWWVDDLRVLQTAPGGTALRVAARDDLEDPDAAARWVSKTTTGSVAAPTRGWTLARVPTVPAHRVTLSEAGVERDGEPNTTRALAWDEPGPLAASAPTWSVARTPSFDLRGLVAPEATLHMRYDLGEGQNGTHDAGVAFIARVTEADGTTRRLLLRPAGEDEAASYRADVTAPAFHALARALMIEVPRGATATALVGNTTEWTPVKLDLTALAGQAQVELEVHTITTRPLQGDGWRIDELRVGEPGPAHDLALVGLPTLPRGTGVGLGVAVPLSVELRNVGAFRSAQTRVDLVIRNATGAAVHEANLTLPQGPLADLRLTFPQPWAPTSYGRHVLEARVGAAPADEDPTNDMLRREIDVHDLWAARLEAASLAADAIPGSPASLSVRLVNSGTLPLDATRATTLFVQVYDGATALLAEPAKMDVAALAGRPVLPGETLDLPAPRVWTPARSGIYRVEAWLDYNGTTTVPLAWSVVAARASDAGLLNATASGKGWTNATTGVAGSLWTFLVAPDAEGSLRLPTANLRAAARASLELDHDINLEQGFDVGVVEAQDRHGVWHPLRASDANVRLAGLTGALGGRTDRYDLAQVPAFRERLPLIDASPSATKVSEVWDGPAPREDAWRASRGRAPDEAAADPPASAVAYRRVDVLAFRLALPSGSSDEVALRFEDWRALTTHVDPELPEGGIEVVLVLPDGTRVTSVEPLAQVARADWQERALVFRAAAPWPTHATLEFRHAEVLRRNGSLFSPAPHHGGWAIAAPRATSTGGDLLMGAPTVRAEAAWLLHDGAALPAAAIATFAPLAAESVWDVGEGGWRATALASYPSARLILPADLRAAVTDAQLMLTIDATLSAQASLDVETSSDGGHTWTPAPRDPQNGSYDVSALIGHDGLLALHARLADREDVLVVRSARIEADVFRGDEIPLRLRATADHDGAQGHWAVRAARLQLVEHGEGLGVRLLSPGAGPVTAGFRTLHVEVLNRGLVPQPATTLAAVVTEPEERGGAQRHANRSVPPLAPGEHARIPLRGADLNWYLDVNASPSHLTLALRRAGADPLLADDALVTSVGGRNVQERATIGAVRVDVQPQAYDPRDAARGTITFTALARNDGEDDATLGPSTLRLWKDGTLVRELTNARPATARLLPNETKNVTWTWRPPADLPAGSYAAEATLVTTTARGAVHRATNGTLLVGPYLATFARIDRFDTTDGWTCIESAACLREERDVVRSAPAAIAFGLPAEGVANAPTETTASSPEMPINLSTGALLRLHARHALPAGHVVSIDAAVVSTNGTLGAWQRVGILGGRSAGYDELRFAENRIDLTGILPPRDARGVRLRLVVPTPLADTPSLIVDDLSVTALDPALPDAGSWVVADGVTKRIPFQVRNAGGLSDLYRVSFEDATGAPMRLPEGWSARIVDEKNATLAAAGSNTTAAFGVAARTERTLTLVLATAPTGASAPLRAPMPIPIVLRSETLPDLRVAGAIDVRARGLARADLAVLALSLRGDEGAAGRARTVDVVVTNRGLAPATVPLDVLVDPPADVLEAPMRLGDGAPVRLGPASTRTFSFSWLPRHAGEHRIRATIDPARTTADANASDDRGELRAIVGATPFPDLRLSLALHDEALLLGVPAAYTLSVTNLGASTARGIEVTFRAGVLDALPSGSPLAVGDLAPGQRWALDSTFTPALPGELRFIASAFARGGPSEAVETMGDNSIARVITIREATARLERLADADNMRYRLTNAGNANETYELEALTPEDWAYALLVNGTPTSLVTLAPRGFVEIVLRTLPSPDALAGEQQLWLAATSRETGQRQRAEARVSVPPEPELRVAARSTTLDADDPALVVEVDNRGNLRETVRFELRDLPPGWRADASSAEVAPRSRATLRLRLDPGQPAPADHSLTLSWRGSAQNGTARASLSVPERRELELEVEARAVAGGVAPLVVHLRNAGNVPIQGALRFEIPQGAASSLEGHAVGLRPGGRLALNGTLALGAEPNGSIRIVARFEGGSSAREATRVLVERADLGLATWSTADADTLEAGATTRHRATVVNRGSVDADDVALELYEDGTLRAYEEIGSLPAGAEADAILPWTATVGSHTLVLRVRAAGSLADADATNDAEARTFHVAEPERAILPAALEQATPPATLAVTLVLLALVAIVARRRA